MHDADDPSDPDDAPEAPRRRFLRGTAQTAMIGSLAASYGTFAAMSGRFLYPADDDRTAWMFVADLARMANGESMTYTAPNGEKAVIARKSDTGTLQDFVALSSVCPHLGCQVHWEAAADRFFCPCHNGTFDPSGKPTGGPPLQANASLLEFPLALNEGLLYIKVPVERLADAGKLPKRPGHDRCLIPKKTRKA